MGLNLLLGLTNPMIDNWGHLGKAHSISWKDCAWPIFRTYSKHVICINIFASIQVVLSVVLQRLTILVHACT